MPEFALQTKLEPPFGNHRLQTLGIKLGEKGGKFPPTPSTSTPSRSSPFFRSPFLSAPPLPGNFLPPPFWDLKTTCSNRQRATCRDWAFGRGRMMSPYSKKIKKFLQKLSRTKTQPKEEVFGTDILRTSGGHSRGYPGPKLRSGQSKSSKRTSILARTSMTRSRGRPRP